jgi:hypothetical protein
LAFSEKHSPFYENSAQEKNTDLILGVPAGGGGGPHKLYKFSWGLWVLGFWVELVLWFFGSFFCIGSA